MRLKIARLVVSIGLWFVPEMTTSHLEEEEEKLREDEDGLSRLQWNGDSSGNNKPVLKKTKLREDEDGQRVEAPPT